MLRPEFDLNFFDEVLRPLQAIGFRASGKSLDLINGILHISFIRLSGKFSAPSSASWILCFRHIFLRLVQDESAAKKMRFDVFDFPHKFTPSELLSRITPLRYHPRLLGFDHDQFDYSNLDQAAVKAELATIRSLILDEFLPWARTLSCEDAREEIKRFGSGAWCESRWIEDYDRHLIANRSAN